MPTGGQDGDGYFSQVIARDPGDGAVASRSLDDALGGEPTRSPIKVEGRAQERIPSPACTDTLFGEVVLAGMRKGRLWGGCQEGGVDDTLDPGSDRGVDGTVVLLQVAWPPARHEEQRLNAAQGCPHGWPIFIGCLDGLGTRKLRGTCEIPNEQALGLTLGGESGRHSASELPCGAGHSNQRGRSSHQMVLS
jgi:hypothetical protein